MFVIGTNNVLRGDSTNIFVTNIYYLTNALMAAGFGGSGGGGAYLANNAGAGTNLTIYGTNTVTNINGAITLDSSGDIFTSGNVNGVNVNASTVTADFITAAGFIGSGNGLTGITASALPAGLQFLNTNNANAVTNLNANSFAGPTTALTNGQAAASTLSGLLTLGTNVVVGGQMAGTTYGSLSNVLNLNAKVDGAAHEWALGIGDGNNVFYGSYVYEDALGNTAFAASPNSAQGVIFNPQSSLASDIPGLQSSGSEETGSVVYYQTNGSYFIFSGSATGNGNSQELVDLLPQSFKSFYGDDLIATSANSNNANIRQMADGTIKAGGYWFNTTNVSGLSSYSATMYDRVIVANPSANSITITLPSEVTHGLVLPTASEPFRSWTSQNGYVSGDADGNTAPKPLEAAWMTLAYNVQNIGSNTANTVAVVLPFAATNIGSTTVVVPSQTSAHFTCTGTNGGMATAVEFSSMTPFTPASVLSGNWKPIYAEANVVTNSTNGIFVNPMFTNAFGEIFITNYLVISNSVTNGGTIVFGSIPPGATFHLENQCTNGIVQLEPYGPFLQALTINGCSYTLSTNGDDIFCHVRTDGHGTNIEVGAATSFGAYGTASPYIAH